MRKRIIGCIAVLCLATVVSSGCAKKEVVKAEEPVPAAQQAPPPAAPEVAQPAPKAPEAPQALPETPTKEAPVQQEPQKAVSQPSLQEQLQTIYFDFDSAALSDQARATLSKDADALAKQPSVKIRIEGNCDERGSDEYNLALGERRAKAAKEYLVNLGVAPDRLTTISYGEEKPVDQGHNEAAWAKNRRDEFVVVK